ncbi:unnamed protein product [Porites evermanni]|uniref:Ion transport domain-containing protein n=1 Tax=Porites evermanni TaxID=104178 RepID=A0ABN8M6N0_9CNID|nr:unnamed protein product [Porites evermanni]
MAERRRERCLTHPVCYVLMNIKWKKFGWITFIVNLLLYLAFLLPFTTLAVNLKINICVLCNYSFCNETPAIPNGQSEWHDEIDTCTTYDKTVVFLHCFVIIFALIHVIKEIMQLVRQRPRRIRNSTVVFNFLNNVSTGLFCSGYDNDRRKSSRSFVVLLTIKRNRCMSCFHAFSRALQLETGHVYLLQGVYWFIYILIMLIAFFFLSQEFHTFEFALLKTFAMTLGELDYENDFIIQKSERHYSEAVNVVFVLFCLAMPIILMNMLIGLAVGDIDKIQQKSVMARYVMQVELLLEIEESLPKWILRRVQVDKHEEFPNRSSKLQTKIYEKFIGFGKAESMGDDDGVPPALAQIIDKVLEQDSKIDEMHEMLKEQCKVVKAIGQRKGVGDDGGPGNRKSLFNWFPKKQ